MRYITTLIWLSYFEGLFDRQLFPGLGTDCCENDITWFIYWKSLYPRRINFVCGFIFFYQKLWTAMTGHQDWHPFLRNRLLHSFGAKFEVTPTYWRHHWFMLWWMVALCVISTCVIGVNLSAWSMWHFSAPRHSTETYSHFLERIFCG